MDIAQARSLIDDKDSAFWKNDPTTVEQVNKAFEVAHPGDDVVGGSSPGLDKVLSESMQKPGTEPLDSDKPFAKSADSTPQELSPEEKQANLEAQQTLYSKYGDKMPSVVYRAQNTAKFLEQDNPKGEMWECLAGLAKAKGVSQVTMVEILNELGEMFGIDDKQRDDL